VADVERLPDLALDLVRSRVDVSVAAAPGAVRAARSIPIVVAGWGSANLVESGIVASFDRRVAVSVDKLLKGASPGEVPIEQPTTFELVGNLWTPRGLGLTIPPSILLRANQVFE
jgi:hypothetical protein